MHACMRACCVQLASLTLYLATPVSTSQTLSLSALGWLLTLNTSATTSLGTTCERAPTHASTHGEGHARAGPMHGR
jgi:hypothetical protein